MKLTSCAALWRRSSRSPPLPRRRDHRSNLTSRSHRARTWLERRVLSQGRRVHRIFSPTSLLPHATMGARATRQELALAISSISRSSQLFRKTSPMRNTATPLLSGSRCVMGVRQGQRSELLLRYTTSG